MVFMLSLQGFCHVGEGRGSQFPPSRLRGAGAGVLACHEAIFVLIPLAGPFRLV